MKFLIGKMYFHRKTYECVFIVLVKLTDEGYQGFLENKWVTDLNKMTALTWQMLRKAYNLTMHWPIAGYNPKNIFILNIDCSKNFTTIGLLTIQHIAGNVCG